MRTRKATVRRRLVSSVNDKTIFACLEPELLPL
jgi:hypothetical protein